MRSIILGLSTLFLLASLVSCTSRRDRINMVGKVNDKTGVKYDEDTFQPKDFNENDVAPGLVLIPGGTFMMGGGEKDIESSKDNRARQATVSSFFMDETEIANVDWKLFLYDVLNGDGGETRFEELYPDTNVWRRDLAFNDPIAETY